MFSSRSFWLGVLTALFGLLLAAEILMRLTIPSGFWYHRFDISGDMSSLSELRDRIRYATPTRPIFLLGDSVLGASALTEHRVPQARTQTLSRYLADRLASQGHSALSLGSDGNLLTDILALNREIDPQPADHILLLLNFRMFSQEFADGPKGLAHIFLSQDLSADLANRTQPNPPLSQEARLSDDLYAQMAQHWTLFRETQMLKTLWYYPSQKDFFQHLLERLVGTNEIQQEIAEEALKQKIASFYAPYLWPADGLAFTSLKQLLDQWTARGVRVTILLTPQNPKFLSGYLDKPSFEKNRARLAKFMKAYKGIHYEDWSAKYPSDLFFDHCHLKPQGNQRYAQDLTGLLGRGL